jgi:hypothetical protein
MKKLCLISVILCIFLSACNGVKNKTVEDTAETFVQALIDGDEEMLNEINKSDPLDFPTHYLISDYAPKFADYKVSDFQYGINEDEGIVEIQSKNDIDELYYKISIVKIGKEYYFTGFRH